MVLGRWLAPTLLMLALAGSAAAASPDSCHPAIDKSLPQYTVGYGSLMEKASKERTAPDTGSNLPVMVTGYERSWNYRGSAIGFSTTYLGVESRDGVLMAAALYRVFSAEDIHATDQRESDYCREPVEPQSIRMLDHSAVPETGQIWIYVNKPQAIHRPDADFPIVQSYVDIFLTGCLELQQRVVGQNQSFAEQCITTTAGWSTHWVNDRLYPRRPFIYQPNAGKIDQLLNQHVPEFKMIRIE